MGRSDLLGRPQRRSALIASVFRAEKAEKPDPRFGDQAAFAIRASLLSKPAATSGTAASLVQPEMGP